MPRPRHTLVNLDATPYYHCINRCVRRAFLCGDDEVTGRNFDHRKQWLVDRMMALADIFAVDVCAYAVMCNHFHQVLRIDRNRALAWTEEEVIDRYGRIFRHCVTDLLTLPRREQSRRIARWRARLWDLSWYMRGLNESIARRANREDNCTGRFWEGRFRSQALLDEGALVTCMSYVDLNPVRAGIADTLDGSEFTSIRERLFASAKAQQPPKWRAQLVPFRQPEDSGSPYRDNLGPLPMQLEEYVQLLETTGGILRGMDPATMPENVSTSLIALGLDPQHFISSIKNFARSFFTMIGHVQRIDTESTRRGYRRRRGITAARRLYRATG